MTKYSIVTALTFCLSFMLSWVAVAADSEVVIESTKNAKKAEWVPPGFESLSEPQLTEIDLYYGDEYLTSVFARFTQQELSFLNVESITQLLKNISDPESVNLILQKPFSTNTSEICHSDLQTDCGTLLPETVDIIFDRAALRADLFINSELLIAGQPIQDRFLPDSSANFSLFTDNAVFFSGISGEETTYNFANTTRIALAESRLLLRSNLTDRQGFTVDTLAFQKEYQGKDYQFGLFTAASSNSRFMDSDQFVGASIASSTLTRIDLDQSLGTEIELFFSSRSRIEILRDDRLLASGYYDIGNQVIDTSMLPPGSYEIEIRISDNSGVMTTERRFFSKTSKLPPDDQSIYFLQAGKLVDRFEYSSGIPELTTSVIRGGYSKRLTPSLGADVGFSVTANSKLYQAGLFKMGNSYELRTEVAVEDNGALASDVSLRWDLDFIRLSITSRKIWEGDTQLQLGESLTQNGVSIDVPNRWGNIGVFARTNKRGKGVDAIEGNNYGLRWQANSFSIGAGDLSASFEVSKNDDDMLAMFSVNYRINGSRSQHSFTPGMSYESYAAENIRQSRLQGNHLSSWVSGDEQQRRFALRTDHDTRSSFEARYEDRQRFGDSDLSARYIVDSQQLEYTGKLSTSFGYDGKTRGFGGRPRGDSAFIIKVDGVPEGTEFEVMVNGSSRGKTLAGKRLLIPVAPYETYRVELNSVGNAIIDIDNKSYRKTVYPGNVVTLEWAARVIKIIIGRIVDESGEPVSGALIRNVKGFGVTDQQGYFQAEVDQSINSLIIQKGMSICEASFEIDDSEKQVVSLGALVCVAIEDPIVKMFPEQFDAPNAIDVAVLPRFEVLQSNKLTDEVATVSEREPRAKAEDSVEVTEIPLAVLSAELTEVPQIHQHTPEETQAPKADPVAEAPQDPNIENTIQDEQRFEQRGQTNGSLIASDKIPMINKEIGKIPGLYPDEISTGLVQLSQLQEEVFATRYEADYKHQHNVSGSEKRLEVAEYWQGVPEGIVKHSLAGSSKVSSSSECDHWSKIAWRGHYGASESRSRHSDREGVEQKPGIAWLTRDPPGLASRASPAKTAFRKEMDGKPIALCRPGQA